MKTMEWTMIIVMGTVGVFVDAQGADAKKQTPTVTAPKPTQTASKPLYTVTDHLVCTGIPAVAAAASTLGGPATALVVGAGAIVYQKECYKGAAIGKQLNNMVTGAAVTQTTPAKTTPVPAPVKKK
ncbi:MAG: hypothetical protein NTY01_24080 [Verrucomicrobia bacterium]|nr:hypothetical protein [Verrucomicrobiota bacterium]